MESPEEFKAWSQNVGHRQVLTTFTSYGAVRIDQQDIIRRLGEQKEQSGSRPWADSSAGGPNVGA